VLAEFDCDPPNADQIWMIGVIAGAWSVMAVSSALPANIFALV
jgi:hypothetical protein